MKDYDFLFVQTAWGIMETLHSAANSAEGLAAGLNVLCGELCCEQGSVWVTDGRDGSAFSLAERGAANHSGKRLQKGCGVVGRTVETGKSVLLNRGEGDPDLGEERDAEQALLWVPLLTPHGVLGCIELRRRGADFEPEEKRMCERCAGILALDLEEKGLDDFPNGDFRTILSLRNVTREYANGDRTVKALDRVSLDVYEKECLAVLGESGSGKSTLLNLIGCMDSPTEGRILLDGKDFSHPTEKEMTEYRRSTIGFVFQTYNLMPTLTAAENIRFIAETGDGPVDAEKALEMVGLSERANHFPSALSGGQQQRVAIARALAKSPRIILADEPTAALDYETGKEVLQVLQTTVRERGATLVIVTHNAEIAKLANRVIRMKDGKIMGVQINPRPLPAAELSW
ncbi:MAG: ATP-binding cassette domain-containing protein [Oscillospiraceae bacterium]|nr:ATP-binding cassette domain-containing protein [Oscillospiraceae bacterium]